MGSAAQWDSTSVLGGSGAEIKVLRERSYEYLISRPNFSITGGAVDHGEVSSVRYWREGASLKYVDTHYSTVVDGGTSVCDRPGRGDDTRFGRIVDDLAIIVGTGSVV